jgi:probable F420-dependent oxidoreductase
MKLGVKFPQTESGQDPGAAIAFVQAAEHMGFDYVTANEHVLGAHPEGRPAAWVGPYTHEHIIHEPLVLFAFLAAVTRRISFATSILVLPLRQTALVAKQAAELDVLSGGRLWLGVGVGWNSVEYEAMGSDFATRGPRIEEQIAVLRAFWTQEVVDFDGRWHKIDRAGVKPMPIQRPIPIWMGGSSNRALDRAGRLADGWFPGGTVLDPYRRATNIARPGTPLAPSVADDWEAQIRQVLASASAAGRPPGSVAIGAEISASAIESGKDLAEVTSKKAALGVTHLTIATQGAGRRWPEGHIEALHRITPA